MLNIKSKDTQELLDEMHKLCSCVLFLSKDVADESKSMMLRRFNFLAWGVTLLTHVTLRHLTQCPFSNYNSNTRGLSSGIDDAFIIDTKGNACKCS